MMHLVLRHNNSQFILHTLIAFVFFFNIGEHMTEDFKANINRFQKVPCIIDDGFKLAESIAILRLVA